MGRRGAPELELLAVVIVLFAPILHESLTNAILLQTLFDSSLSFELSDLERYRAIKLIAMLFINITVFKDVCKRVSFVG